MPVEDVQYLIEHSVKDSTLVFIDSSTRDRQHHPTPAEYTVTFNEPVRHVFGIDVLDATIPGTMFNVDVHNNNLQVIIFDQANSTALSATPDLAGALAGLVPKVGLSADMQAWCQDPSRANSIVAVVDGPVWDNQTPSVRTPSVSAGPPVAVTSGARSCVLVRRVVTGVPLEAVGSDIDAARSVIEGNVVFQSDGSRYAIASSHPLAERLTAIAAGVTIERQPLSLLYDLTYFDAFTVAQMYDTATGAWSLGIDALLVLWVANMQLEPGNYVLNPPVTGNDASLINTLTQMLDAVGIVPGSTTTSAVDKQLRIAFASPAPFAFNFNVSESCSSVLGFDEWATGSSALRFGTVASSQPLFVGVPNTGNTSFRVQAPGIVNLLGVRYVTLRCPEVEEHLNSTDKYGDQATGVGVFKLSSSAELFNLRFDFVSLIRKPFHPIGRMHRMSLRFERQDGSLYDFKGINHTILLTIKYYNPTPVLRFEGSVLNPDYDPDFMTYVSRRLRDRAQEAAGDRGDHDEAPDPDVVAQRIKDDVVRRIISEQARYSGGNWDEDSDDAAGL